MDDDFKWTEDEIAAAKVGREHIATLMKKLCNKGEAKKAVSIRLYLDWLTDPSIPQEDKDV